MVHNEVQMYLFCVRLLENALLIHNVLLQAFTISYNNHIEDVKSPLLWKVNNVNAFQVT